MSRYLRTSSADEDAHASNLELFYDLVFVLAVTQVSHLLLDQLTWGGVGRSLLVLLGIWWAWTNTTWVTNMLDPDATVVRLLVLSLMFASLVMAVAIPDAFGSRALLFAGAYVAIQVGRTAFLAFVVAGRGSPERAPATHTLAWFLASGAFWLAGGFASSARITLWLIAIAIDYSAPLVFYRVPGRRRLSPDSWNVETSHFAERFQLFIIIALGESIVVTGATTSELPLDAARFAALGLAFLSTAAFWWLYFHLVATISQLQLASAQDSTTLARDGYTFLHVIIVAGIIVSAVGDELVIAHPRDTLPTPELIALVAGPAIYLLGHTFFRLRMAGSVGWRRLVGAAACLIVGLVGRAASALVVAALLVGVLAAVIASEQIAGRRRANRGEPSTLERLEASTSV
ncbi:MAG: low temperature requirement protein A [Thermoleophilia bacterium]|nr:low temperature requirement protein A [Thermoleophilia bacterium]